MTAEMTVVWALKTPASRAVSLWVPPITLRTGKHFSSPSTGGWWAVLNTHQCVSSRMNHCCSWWEQQHVYIGFVSVVLLGLKGSAAQVDSSTQAAGTRGFLSSPASFLLGEMQSSTNRTQPPLTKYSCTNQLKVLFPWWENWRHLCVCSIFGEITVTSLLAAKYNNAAANNNAQAVFNRAHDHFKHESVFTKPLEDKGKVETAEPSEPLEVTKAACSKGCNQGAPSPPPCCPTTLPCALGGWESRPTEQLHVIHNLPHNCFCKTRKIST